MGCVNELARREKLTEAKKVEEILRESEGRSFILLYKETESGIEPFVYRALWSVSFTNNISPAAEEEVKVLEGGAEIDLLAVLDSTTETYLQ